MNKKQKRVLIRIIISIALVIGLQFVPFNTLNDERYGIYWYFDTEKNNDKE